MNQKDRLVLIFIFMILIGKNLIILGRVAYLTPRITVLYTMLLIFLIKTLFIHLQFRHFGNCFGRSNLHSRNPHLCRPLKGQSWIHNQYLNKISFLLRISSSFELIFVCWDPSVYLKWKAPKKQFLFLNTY